MDPFELCVTEEQVDEKLKDLEQNGRHITLEISQQAIRRKLQIQSQNGKCVQYIFFIFYTNVC